MFGWLLKLSRIYIPESKAQPVDRLSRDNDSSLFSADIGAPERTSLRVSINPLKKEIGCVCVCKWDRDRNGRMGLHSRCTPLVRPKTAMDEQKIERIRGEIGAQMADSCSESINKTCSSSNAISSH